ncbi:MAG TPA: hypothetical protein DIV44_14525 [Leeuwenhoekiella sp.]|nr:hypothetical protein [Leeuwenhoekiella sp.]MBH13508.1 hypothetical protein [Leeuwenhoekiella sp.]HAX16830.1 hypothetical protein [Leeuwenhoekiella sp.]HBO29224.1 hypothetical protein [Leeuwenhoekiella sp.]HCQ78020.1 hypothetical protein [Leeuwenhoekiella sp.]|tara:strand:+ start:360 stop:959 length:600 start_codon:yes stop_codon:yes gene_type:complete
MSSDKAPQINLKQSSDEDLVRIVTVQVHKYEPYTVQAAEAEISRRGIDKMRMAHLVKKVAQDNTAVQEIQDYMSTTWTRFVNFLIDFIVFLLLVLIGSLSLDSVFVTSNSDFLLAVGYGMVLLIFLLYHGLTEYFFQKTVGKYITKTIVVTKDGEKPDAGTIALRTLCRLIPFDRLSFLITKNGFHDRFSNTQVVKDPS